MHPTELLTAEFTRLQWKEIKKALRTRRQFLRKGVREATVFIDDVRMVEALIQDVNELLADFEQSDDTDED